MAEPSAIGLQTPVYPFGGELCDGVHSGEIRRGSRWGVCAISRVALHEMPAAGANIESETRDAPCVFALEPEVGRRDTPGDAAILKNAIVS